MQAINPPLFYVLAALVICSALVVVRVRNIFHGALALGLTFLGVAGLYITLHAEFLAGMQVLIYVGAVVVLILFGIMLTQQLHRKDMPSFNALQPLALAATLLTAVVMGYFITSQKWSSGEPLIAASPESHVRELGICLMRDYLVPFEVLSVLLLAALLGALVIARKEGKPGDRS
ncbi:MAG: NADH-quinone oxidoreductase subunit J [Candidatus Eremiobacteraeota bacterium]|nr:NADH-quinone oxidoreductase subunit J [Candidatus Eremiobacteraeota bacterium]